MNKITGFSVLTTGEGERVTLSYSVLDADGNIVSTNNRKNYVCTGRGRADGDRRHPHRRGGAFGGLR